MNYDLYASLRIQVLNKKHQAMNWLKKLSGHSADTQLHVQYITSH